MEVYPAHSQRPVSHTSRPKRPMAAPGCQRGLLRLTGWAPAEAAALPSPGDLSIGRVEDHPCGRSATLAQ